MYVYQRTPMGNPYFKPYIVGIHGLSLENTINAMGTLLGVHPIVPWLMVYLLSQTDAG